MFDSVRKRWFLNLTPNSWCYNPNMTDDLWLFLLLNVNFFNCFNFGEPFSGTWLLFKIFLESYWVFCIIISSLIIIYDWWHTLIGRLDAGSSYSMCVYMEVRWCCSHTWWQVRRPKHCADKWLQRKVRRWWESCCPDTSLPAATHSWCNTLSLHFTLRSVAAASYRLYVEENHI